MITTKVINRLYKIYSTCSPAVHEEITQVIPKLTHHNMRLEAGLLRYDCDEDSMLFNEVPEEKIHGVEEFDTCVAIVLYSCILFFDKNSTKVSMHIKMPHITLMERISKFLHLG